MISRAKEKFIYIDKGAEQTSILIEIFIMIDSLNLPIKNLSCTSPWLPWHINDVISKIFPNLIKFLFFFLHVFPETFKTNPIFGFVAQITRLLATGSNVVVEEKFIYS